MRKRNVLSFIPYSFALAALGLIFQTTLLVGCQRFHRIGTAILDISLSQLLCARFAWVLYLGRFARPRVTKFHGRLINSVKGHIPVGAGIHPYQFGWLLGFVSSAFVYLALNCWFPATEILIDRAIPLHDLLEREVGVAEGKGSQIEGNQVHAYSRR